MANSFPGSGLAYVDQFAIGRSSGTGLLNTFLSADPNTNQIRVETDNSAVLTYIGISAGIMEYYRGANTSGTLRFQTKVQAASLANGGGAIVFSPNGTASDYTPVERMRILMNGNVGIGTDVPSTILNIASSAPTIRLNPTTQNNSTAIEFGVLNASNNAYAKIDATNTVNYDTNLRFFTNGIGSLTQVERMRIGYNGNIGIGTTSPDDLLDATLGLSVYSSTGRAGIAISGNTTTADEVLGRLCFSNNSSTNAGNKRLAYISGVRGTTNNSAYLEFGTANDALGTQRMVITQAGGVGIGTSAPGTYRLNVNGTFYSAGSSLEYKINITTLATDTNKILELRPVTYQYKDEYKHLGKELKSGTQIGLIAEEVAEVFPELALLKQDEDGEIRVRNVDYEKLSILLLSEVQKLRKEVNELKAQ
jgi:hypothetical protein